MKLFYIFLIGFCLTLIVVVGGPILYFTLNSDSQTPAVSVLLPKRPLDKDPNYADKIEYSMKVTLPNSERFKGAVAKKYLPNVSVMKDTQVRFSTPIADKPAAFPLNVTFSLPKVFVRKSLEAAAPVSMRFEVIFCSDPSVACDNPKEPDVMMVSYLLLDKAHLEKGKVDLGDRIVNEAVLPNEKGATQSCDRNGEISGAITATKEAINTMAGRKTILFVYSPLENNAMPAKVAASTNVQELTFAGNQAPFSVKVQAPWSGSYRAALITCAKTDTNEQCLKNSRILDAKKRSDPFIPGRSYAILLKKDLDLLRCGETGAQLMVHTFKKSEIESPFSALNPSLPMEFRASPWAAFCSDCQKK